jgi:CzcA family heavy metal efflux pump
MLSRLIEFSLKNAGIVLVGAVLLLVGAIVRLRTIPVDVFPELNAPTVVVLTEAGGLAADEVEQYVTFPIETSVNGLPGVRRVRSSSATSLSIVWAEFDWGIDIFRARQLVAERLAAVREQLPEDTHAEITPVTSITGEIMLLALSSPSGAVNALDLRSYAEFELRNRLLAIPGIAQVIAIGGELPEFQVNVRHDSLALYGLTVEDVVVAARGAHSTASAGFLPDVDRQEIPIRQAARVQSVSDIAGTIVRYVEGTPVTIGQVADVKLGPAPRRGTAADGGVPAVVMTIQKSPGTNTLALTDAIDAALDQIEPTLPAGVELNRRVFRQSEFIQRSIDNVSTVLRDATLIVAAILILFLMNLRTTLITLAALPLSLAATLLILDAAGLTINVMTLGGIAVAIGVLVDDAIIDVENVHRRLTQARRGDSPGRSAAHDIVLRASNEIRPSMVFATIIIVIVFVPLLYLEGIEGRFFRPLGLTYIASILASLLVALTVTPALCKLLLAGMLDRGAAHEEREGRFVRWLKGCYQPSLAWSLRHRKTVLGGAALAIAGSLAVGRSFGTAFLPEFNEGTFTVFLMAPPGTSLDESDRVARWIEKRLVAIEGVRSVTRRTGRAERDEHAEPPSNSEVEVTVELGHDKERIRAAIDEIVSNVPGITTMIGQPIEHRLSHILSGTPAAIAINVFGADLATLREVARRIQGALESIPGTRDVNAAREVLVTSLPIRYRHQDLAAAGLTPSAAAMQVQAALAGETVAEVHLGVRRVGLTVRLAPEERERLDQIEDLTLRGMGGALVRLRDVADIGPERTSNLIARENAQRKAVISCNVGDGTNLGDLVERVREKVDPIVRDAGLTVQYGGQFEAQESATRTLLIGGALVALVMFLLLQLSTGSFRVAALVLVNLPLSILGGIAAIYLVESQNPLEQIFAVFGASSAEVAPPVVSIASLIGFVTLFGIAVRNGILLVNHYHHVAVAEGRPLAEAIERGSVERLVPILMTALSSALGLVPLALALGEPGSELLAPLAVVVLGGLISSTFLNLVVVPAGYSLIFSVDHGQGPIGGEAGGDAATSLLISPSDSQGNSP